MANIEVHLFDKSRNEQLGVIRIDSDIIPRVNDLLTIDDNKFDSGLNSRVFQVFQIELSVGLTNKNDTDRYIGCINPKNRMVFVSAVERY